MSPPSYYLALWDYVIVSVTLVLSAGLGLYNGCFKVKVVSFSEYVLGSRTIPLFPILMSTFATVIASGFVLGVPAEYYCSGIAVFYSVVVWIPLVLVVNYIVLPVYRQMPSGSVFEFYEFRYMKTLKEVVTVLYTAMMVFFSSVTLYGPSTAFNLVTGIDVWIIVTTINGLCMLYTVLGGMRAVVFADMIQGLQLLAAMVILMVVGTVNVGGIGQLWNINLDGKRLEQDFRLDPTVPDGVWNYALAWPFTYMCYYVSNQMFMQRLLACETLKQGRRVTILSVCVTAAFNFAIVYLGLLVFAAFSQCDPLRSGGIKNYNQIAPLYVMHTFHEYPGLPGMYFAGILCACLSTLSSCYNALAAICVQTFVLPKFPNMSDPRRTNVCKVITVGFGTLTIFGVIIAQKYSNVMQAATNVGSVITSPLFALFVVGVLCPQANKKGCVTAFIIGVTFGVWLIAGELVIPRVFESSRPFSIDGCPSNLTSPNSSLVAFPPSAMLAGTSNETGYGPEEAHPYLKYMFPLHKVSYQYLGIVMFFLTSVLCFVFSYIFGREVADEKILNLLPEVVRRFHRMLGPKLRHYLLCQSPVANVITPCPTEMIPLTSSE